MVLHNVIISTNSECFGEWRGAQAAVEADGQAWQSAVVVVGKLSSSRELSIMWHIFHGIQHSRSI